LNRSPRAQITISASVTGILNYPAKQKNSGFARESIFLLATGTGIVLLFRELQGDPEAKMKDIVNVESGKSSSEN